MISLKPQQGVLPLINPFSSVHSKSPGIICSCWQGPGNSSWDLRGGFLSLLSCIYWGVCALKGLLPSSQAWLALSCSALVAMATRQSPRWHLVIPEEKVLCNIQEDQSILPSVVNFSGCPVCDRGYYWHQEQGSSLLLVGLPV